MPVAFSEQQKKEIQALIGRYPDRKSALGDVLYLAQEQFGHFSTEIEEYVAGLLDLPVTVVHEVVTFYVLYLKEPVGRHHIMLCDNVSCLICGSDALLARLREKLGIGPGQTTPDRRFTLWTVECLGGCDLAPMAMIDYKFHGNLTPDKLDKLLDSLE